MSWQPTLIERLEVKHPGLEKDVCDWLKSYVTEVEIAARLRAKYNETVRPKTIDNYKQRRMKAEEKRVHEQKVAYQGFMQAVGEEGLDAGAAANLWEALQRMTPEELIALRRLQVERTRVEVLSKRADADVQRAENEQEKLKATLAQLKREQSDADSDHPVDPLEIRRRIREIYGLEDDSAQFEAQPLNPAQAVKDIVDTAAGLNQPLEERVEPDESESQVRDPQASEINPEALSPKSDDKN